MPRSTAAEKAAEETAAAEEARRRTDRQRMTWAGLVLAAVAVFATGYIVGNAADDDTLVGSDSAVAESATNPRVEDPPTVGGQDLTPAPRPGRGPGRSDGAIDGRPGASTTADPGYLGVGVRQSVDGVVIVGVADDGPAAMSGFEVGDLVVSFDGVDVTTVAEFARAVRLAGAGADVEITVLRSRTEITLAATLSEFAN